MTSARWVGIAMILGAVASAVGGGLVWQEPSTARQLPVVLFDPLQFLQGTLLSVSLPLFLLGLILVVVSASAKIAWAKLPIYFLAIGGLCFAFIEGPYLVAVGLRLSGSWLHNAQEGENWLMTGAMLVSMFGPYFVRWRKLRLTEDPPNAGV